MEGRLDGHWKAARLCRTLKGATDRGRWFLLFLSWAVSLTPSFAPPARLLEQSSKAVNQEPALRDEFFRLSFLDSETVLADTCKLLQQAGFPDSTISTYNKLVRAHNLNGNRVDRSHFPAERNGFYEFTNLQQLIASLDRPLGQTPSNHTLSQNTLTCFDVVALMLQGEGCQLPRLQAEFSTVGIVLATPESGAHRVSYGAWYANSKWLLYPEKGYEQLVGRPRTTDEEALNLALRAARSVEPDASTPEAMVRQSFLKFLNGMKRGEFVFPRECEVGLAFFARPGAGYVFADHAFLCFRRNNRLICLEKVGSPGPYVRAEFSSEADLGRFVSWDELQAIRHSSSSGDDSAVAVSLNERVVGLWSGKDSKGRDVQLPQPVTAQHGRAPETSDQKS